MMNSPNWKDSCNDQQEFEVEKTFNEAIYQYKKITTSLTGNTDEKDEIRSVNFLNQSVIDQTNNLMGYPTNLQAAYYFPPDGCGPWQAMFICLTSDRQLCNFNQNN